MNVQTTATPSPSEVLATQVAEAIARGEDPLGDEDPLEADDGGDDGEADESGDSAETTVGQEDATAPAATAAAEGGDAATTAAAADQLDADALAAVAGGDDDDTPEPVPLQVSDKDFAAERTRIAAAEDEVEVKWSKGDLTDAERATELRKLRDEQNQLISEETRAQTIADMNRQSVQRHQLSVLEGLARESKAAGQLDYSDAKVGKAFDGMLAAVCADPDNEGKSFKQLTRLAHEALCAVRGVKPAPAPAAAAAAPAQPGKREVPKPPQTLRNLPSASTPNTGGDAVDAMAGLKGQAYQDAFARLSPAQKARLLDE